MITWSPAFQPCNYSLCIPVYAVTFTAVKCCYFLLPGPGRDLSLPSTGSSLFCQQKDITMHINNVSVLTEAFSGFGLDACWNQCKGKAAEEESPAPGVSLRGCDAGSGRLHETQGSFMAAWRLRGAGSCPSGRAAAGTRGKHGKLSRSSLTTVCPQGGAGPTPWQSCNLHRVNASTLLLLCPQVASQQNQKHRGHQAQL